MDRGMREMVRSMEHLPADCSARLQLAGPCEPAVQLELAAEPGWRRVDFHGQLDRSAVGRLLEQSRVGMVVHHATDAFQEAWPTKLFEYMAAGLPAIVTDMPLYRGLIGSADCAVFVDPHSPPAIAGAIQHLLSREDEAQAMGCRARQAVAERFSWTTEERTLLECYAHLVGASQRSA
jgi:glycosyltransferase involved in cell wall biosynthesis